MKILQRRDIDMREGPILQKMLLFAVPIFFGSVFQQMYNMVDSIVVGKFVSAHALASVGSTSTLTMLLVGLMTGFPNGASIVAAQFRGAGQDHRIKATVSTTLLFLLGFSLAVCAAGLLLSRPIMGWMNVPGEILEDTLVYFRIYILGMVFMALYNFYASFLRALGDSSTPLLFLIISCLLNIAGDLFFVLVLDLGVAGVAWATVAAQGISVILCQLYVSRTTDVFRFRKGELVFDRELFRDILRLGLPTSIQSSISGLGMVAVQGMVNGFGAASIAAYTASNKLESLCLLPTGGISVALSLFTGQNIGAGNHKRARKGFYIAMLATMGVSLVMAAVVFLFCRPIMGLFVNDTETEVIRIGMAFIRFWTPFIVLRAPGQDAVSFLRGAGDSVMAMFSMFFDLGVRLILAYILVMSTSLGVMSVAYAIPAGWIGCSLVALLRFRTGAWRNKAVVQRAKN